MFFRAAEMQARGVWSIALNTWRETFRDHLIVSVLVFLFVALGLVSLLEHGTGNGVSILDLSLALMRGVAVVVAIFLGTASVHRELDRRTVYVVLTKPVTRVQFVLGKYIGVMLTLLALLVIMGGAASAELVLLGIDKPAVYAVLVSLGFELAFVTAVAMAFASATSLSLSVLYTTFLYLLGLQTNLVYEFALSEAPLVARHWTHAFNYWGGLALYYVLPHFDMFDYKNQVVYGRGLSWLAWAWACAYGSLMSVFALLLARSGLMQRELN